jgi:hypothetical protein
MPIKLNSLETIATIIKTKYGANLYNMNFIFCLKKENGSYFIFQEFQGMPIKRVVYHESNNSVTLVASWSAWSNPYAMITDANFESIEQWKDLQDRSRPYNSYIQGGGFNTSMWKSANRYNKTEKKKKHKNRYDTFVEFRVDKIHRANFNEWGFELYSDTISMIAFRHRNSFPYNLMDAAGEEPSAPVYGLGFNQHPPVDTDADGIFSNRITWQGGSFKIPNFTNEEELSQISSNNTIGGTDDFGGGDGLSSYWDANEHDEENELFDQELSNMLLSNREKDDTIFDVGQKQVDLYFGD